MLKNQYNTDKSAMVNRNDEGAPSQDTVLVFQGVLSGTVYCAESPAGCRYVPVVFGKNKERLCCTHFGNPRPRSMRQSILSSLFPRKAMESAVHGPDSRG
jgi:hypothetical protein